MSFWDTLMTVLVLPIFRSPIIAGILTIIVFYILVKKVWEIRLALLRYEYIASRQWITLELRIPKEVERSPAAMEIFLMNALYQAGGIGTPMKKFWEGKVLNWVSLEIVSFGGSVHFYIRAHSWMKDIIEAQLYAQFPQLDIIEVEDYTDRIPPHQPNYDWDLLGGVFKKELADVYPIRTYRDWGVDKHYESLETEQQIDPLSSVIEAMSSLRAGEEWWIQIILQAHKGKSWQERAEAEILRLQKMYRDRFKDPEGKSVAYTLTEGEKDTINAIERSMDKFKFEVGIRMIYLARKDRFDPGKERLLGNAFAPFASQSLNKLSYTNYVGFDNPWEDYQGFLDNKKKAQLLEDYRSREYFNGMPAMSWFDWYMNHIDPFDQPSMVMTTEEIATIFHIPGRMVQTPGIERIESRKAEPPVNLPI